MVYGWRNWFGNIQFIYVFPNAFRLSIFPAEKTEIGEFFHMMCAFFICLFGVFRVDFHSFFFDCILSFN